ncbi:MAG TPA: DUF1264 domain-containing protein [Pirellulales bacterium]|nr:DUF1264 domain-containing protein [Pirellulales bacterium]
MDRRELLGVLGAVSGGLALGGPASRADDADDHEHDGGDERYMAPVRGLHAHFCGIHIAKKNPKFQLVAQHFCAPRSDEMHQCLLYDSCEKNARLLGVEYIVSDRLFRELPDTEKKYWHPHTYEVLAGGLIAPSMKPDDEMAFMKHILTTWGKTWHTWPDPTTDVPMGEPLLMWAVTGDGQQSVEVVADRDRQFGVSTEEIRRQRGEAFGLEVPKVSQPKSMDQIGRQWTNTGDDKPTKKKKSTPPPK